MLIPPADKYTMKGSIEWAGQVIGRPINGPMKLRFIFIYLLHVVTIIQMAILQIYSWKDLNTRFLALEEINVMFSSIICFFQAAFSFDKMKTLFYLFEDSKIYHAIPLSDKQKELRNECIEKEETSLKRLLFVFFTYLLINILPSLYGLYEINFMRVEITSAQETMDLHTPLKCWYPFSIRNNFNYIAAVILQILCRYYSAIIYVLLFGSALGRMETIISEIKMFTSYVIEIDERLGESPDEESIKKYISQLVDQHIILVQSIKKYSTSAGVILLSYNQAQVVELCLVLYGTVEDTEVSQRIRYTFILGMVLLLMSLMCSFGQHIIDEGENLCLALERTSWINKPMSYKRSIMIMMAFAQRPLVIRPYEIYDLDNTNLTNVVRAGYSYLNVMRTFKA